MRSLVNHIDELRVLLATSPIDVLTINETWLNSTISDNDVYIPGYEIIRRDRAFRSADGKTYGGVCFYVRSSVNFIQRKDMSIDDLENLCIQIQKPNSKPFLVATWYRPPNSNVDKFNYFETFIDMLDAENVEYYLLGDLNCDLGSPDLESNSRSLIGITELYGLHQAVCDTTRNASWDFCLGSYFNAHLHLAAVEQISHQYLFMPYGYKEFASFPKSGDRERTPELIRRSCWRCRCVLLDTQSNSY